MSENQPFPDHIYDQERIDLARMIIEKEYRKLFLGLPDEAWQVVDESIKGWHEHPADYHLDATGPLDFWNSLAAVMESVKLKPSFTTWITAENVQWRKTTVPIRRIKMSSPLAQLEKVPGLNLRNELPLAELIDVLLANPGALPEQERLSDQHSTDPAQDDYPIIAREDNKDGLVRLMDGNRRTLKAVIYGQGEIEAWVGYVKGGHPKNFWVPINDMLQLVKIFKEAIDNNDDVLQQSVVNVLRSRFEVSAVAKQAYQKRIANQAYIARRLFDLANKSFNG